MVLDRVKGYSWLLLQIMKPTGKLNPIVDKQEPVISELRTVNKLLEDIKLLLNEANHGQNDSLTKGLEKLVEEAAKQKKIMNKVRLAIQTKNQDGADSILAEKSSVSAEKTDGHPLTPQETNGFSGTRTSEIKHLVSEQNQLLQKQNQILATTSTLLGSMGTMMSSIQNRLNSEHSFMPSPNPLAEPPLSHLDIIFKQMQSDLIKNPKNKQIVEKWVGELIRIAAQDAFLAYTNKIEEDEVRMLFSTYVLENYRKYITRLSKLQNVSIQLIQKIFYDSCKKTLEYLKFKFPQAKKKISDMSLSEKIQSNGKKVEPDSDILRGGNIQLDFSRVSALRSSVKHLINVLITHGNQKYQMFKGKMLDIFSEVEKDDKERSFHFLIGRKIKQSTPIYNENEVNSPGNFVKGNEILRILMKWIEELMEYFTSPEKIKNNKSGFKTVDGEIKKLGIKDRDKLWLRFEAMNNELKKDLKEIEMELRKTVTNIILISENDIGSKFGGEVDFLDKEETALLIICQYIYKALESYVMDVIVAILNRFNAIKQSFVETGDEEADLELYTLTIGDLFRCKCSGTKSQILRVYQSLIREDKQGPVFKILRVKNRLAEGTQDILINFMMRQSESFFICEIQLALSTAKEEINDHFNHFLYEQHRSPHGVITELGIMLFNLDPRRLYLNKHKLVFINNNRKFQFLEDKGRLCCINHSQKQLIKKEKTKYYVCNNCGRFIDAYRFYFDAQECPTCFNNVCPICQFQILPESEVVKRMLEFAPKLEGYFKLIGKPLLNLQISEVKDRIQELLKTEKYLGVLWLRNNLDSFELKVIKMFKTEVVFESDDEDDEDQEDEEEQEQKVKEGDKQGSNGKIKDEKGLEQSKINKQKSELQKNKKQKKKKVVQYILTAFSNLQFNFQDLQDSIIFLIRPQNLNDIAYHDFQNAPQQKYQEIYDLQVDFNDDDQNIYDLYQIHNSLTNKNFAIDYHVEDEKELVSKAKINRAIKNVEEKNQRAIALDDFIIDNLEQLREIKNKEKITEVELSRGITYSEHNWDGGDYEDQEEGGDQQGNRGEDKPKEEKKEGEEDGDEDEEDGQEGEDGQGGQQGQQGQKEGDRGKQNEDNKEDQKEDKKITQLHVLNDFVNLTVLSLYSLGSYYSFIDFSFNKKLTEIVIKSCSLQTFNFSLVPNARTIDLSSNWIENVLPIHNNHLEVLSLSCNSLASIAFLDQSSIPRLTKLVLDSNSIQQDLPILKFPELRVFDASYNQITGIDNLKLSELPKLKNMLLQTNKIPSLPDISNLLELTKISLSDNLIVEVELLAHQKMETLQLNNNQIKAISKFSMKNLRYLNLSKNKIIDSVSVSNVLGSMQGGSLDLIFNQFPQLPLEKMKVTSILVERSKVKFQIPNIWSKEEERDNGTCDKCKEVIVTIGLYISLESGSYYCKECFDRMKEGMEKVDDIVQVVEITDDDMTRKA